MLKLGILSFTYFMLGPNQQAITSTHCGYAVVPGAQFLKTTVRLFHLIGDKAPPATRDSSEVAVFTSGSFGVSVGVSVLDEAMDAARSAL